MPITIDPDVAFGVPTIDGIRTEILADAFVAGENVERLADDFGLSIGDVQEALRSELRSEAA